MASTTQRILSEGFVTLADAAKRIGRDSRKTPDKTTLYRWCLRGVGGIKLEHVRIGNRILVSRQSLTRFIEARTEATS